MKSSRVVSLISAASMLLFFTPPEVHAQQPGQGQSPQKIEVEIVIDVTPASFRDEIRSYYLRELRSLGDVTIVEKGGGYEIVVNVLQLRNTNGFATGWVATETYFDRYALPGLIAEGRGQCKGGTCELLIGMLADGRKLLDTQMASFGRDGLRAHAQEAVAYFDGRFLESERKSQQWLQQLMQQWQNRAPNQPKGR